MLVPKRVKHHKVQRGHVRGEAKGGKTATFGELGLQALDSYWISNRQIETTHIAMMCYMKRDGKVWVKIFPQLSYTGKDVGVRMGNGKGAPGGWVVSIKRGKVMFEVGGVSEEVAREALRLADYKLPIRTEIVQREGTGGQSSKR